MNKTEKGQLPWYMPTTLRLAVVAFLASVVGSFWTVGIYIRENFQPFLLLDIESTKPKRVADDACWISYRVKIENSGGRSADVLDATVALWRFDPDPEKTDFAPIHVNLDTLEEFDLEEVLETATASVLMDSYDPSSHIQEEFVWAIPADGRSYYFEAEARVEGKPRPLHTYAFSFSPCPRTDTAPETAPVLSKLGEDDADLAE